MLSSVVIIIPLMSKFLPNNRIITSAIDANMKFTVIPAIATQNNPGLSGFNLEKFTGTGFAQPISDSLAEFALDRVHRRAGLISPQSPDAWPDHERPVIDPDNALAGV